MKVPTILLQSPCYECKIRQEYGRNKSQYEVRAQGFRISKHLKMVFSVKIPGQNEYQFK